MDRVNAIREVLEELDLADARGNINVGEWAKRIDAGIHQTEIAEKATEAVETNKSNFGDFKNEVLHVSIP